MTASSPTLPAARQFVRHFGPTLRPIGFRIEPAPWLDVLILLFFFGFSQSARMLRPGIAVDLPVAPFTDGAPAHSRVITLTQEGFLFVDEQRTPMDGLAAVFQQIAHEDPETPILIEADPRIPHRLLVEIFDQASSAGLRRVILATRLPERGSAAP